MPHLVENLRTLERIVRRGGVRAGLIFLNGLTDYRFTSLYRFDDNRLRNLFFFDREHRRSKRPPRFR